jgi:hypothetical protein
MINEVAKYRAESVLELTRIIVREAEQIRKEFNCPDVAIKIVDTPTFWSAIEVLLCGEWRRLTSSHPDYIVLTNEVK